MRVKKKMRKPIFFYFISMIVLFLVILFGQQLFTSIVKNNLIVSRFGSEALFEIIWAGLVLLLVLIFKNKYIFTQKQEGYFKSFKYIMPELILSMIFFFISFVVIKTSDTPIDFSSIFNLGLFCFFIGIVEEFLCRGWLLNEFLERYSNNKKEIILSILFSSFIFGVVHFINMGDNQGFIETLLQVINAGVGGIFLALVYYQTKNIWVVVTSHAIWDFSLFLGQATSLGDCVITSTPSKAMIISNVIRIVVLTVAYLILCYWLYRKTDLYSGKNKKKNWLVIIGVIMYLFGVLAFSYQDKDYDICPEYTRKKLNGSYKVSYYKVDYDNENLYRLNSFPLELSYNDEDESLIIKNSSDGGSVILAEKDVEDFILVENDSTYSILIQIANNQVLYGSYEKKSLCFGSPCLKSIKEGLKMYVVPVITSLGEVEIIDDGYRYPIIENDLSEILYFGKDGKLYINK